MVREPVLRHATPLSEVLERQHAAQQRLSALQIDVALHRVHIVISPVVALVAAAVTQA